MTRSRLADGSVGGRRLEAACVRAIDTHLMLGRKADKLLNALDEMTTPGVVSAPIDDEDSLVIALQSMTDKTTS